MTEVVHQPHSSVYPRLIDDDVFLCGFNSPKSYGAMSYFIRHPDGNWLIDSPRFIPYLENKFAEMGGLKYIFLTHRDDVGDCNRYAQRFKARRVIHEYDRDAVPEAEILVRGDAPFSIGPEFVIIPVPGHTRGHSVLLYKNRFLFTGDHLEWDPSLPGLNAFRDYCWYDWTEQTRSMEKLLHFPFEWVLPGHGRAHLLPMDHRQQELTRLIQRMKKPSGFPQS